MYEEKRKNKRGRNDERENCKKMSRKREREIAKDEWEEKKKDIERKRNSKKN